LRGGFGVAAACTRRVQEGIGERALWAKKRAVSPVSKGAAGAGFTPRRTATIAN